MNKLSQCAFMLLTLVLVACHSGSQHPGKTVFNLNLEESLTSLDPAFARNQFALWMDNQLYNGLLQIDDSLHLRPCLAKSWAVSANGTRYTFNLRRDAYFHPSPLFKNGIGRRVVAADFVYSFSRLVDPKVASSGSWIFSDKISGPQAFLAINDSTFAIQLKRPFPPMLSLLTAQYCSVVPREVVTYYGKDFRSHPIGTGPFMFKYWKEGEVLVLLKNPHYWEVEHGHRLPYLDAIKASFINDKQTAFMEFLKHNLDFFNSIDGSYRDDILTKSGQLTKKYRGRFQFNSRPYLCTEYLGMLVDTNLPIVKKSPLRLLKVRQAINYAIDKQKLIKYLRNNVGTPGYAGFIPKGMPGFNAKATGGYSYNPERARLLLAQAGYPQGNNMPEIVLSASSGTRDIMEFIQGELGKVGIRVKVEVAQSASLRELIAKNGVNFFRGTWIADYADAENYLSVFYSKNKIPFGPNYTSFFNKQFDALFEQAYTAKTDTQRYQLYKRMDSIVMSQSPVVVLYYDKLVNLYQNNITGYSKNAQNLLTLKRVKKL